MTDPSLIFLYIVYFTSIFLHVVAGFVTAIFVIPLQYEQTQVKNGLSILRRWLLIRGLITFILIIASILALTGRFIFGASDTSRYIITTMILLHGLATLAKSWIDYNIYHNFYTPKEKKI